MKRYDLTKDRTNKSNVHGSRIDLLSELMLWEANNRWTYELNEQDKYRRTVAINLLRKLQDVNFLNFSQFGVFIIMNSFPELKKYIENKFDTDNNNEDTLHSSVEELTEKITAFIENNSVSFLTNKNLFQLKDNFKNDSNEIFNKYKKYDISNDSIKHIDNYEYAINSNTPYILFNSCVSINNVTIAYKFISNYDDNGKLQVYELIGIQLSNSDHAVCFTKKGKEDNSWYGIDSNRNANDNNYKLEDIIYNENLVKNDSKTKDNDNIIIQDNNTYLAKVYANKEVINNNKLHPYDAQMLLYKKLSLEELQNMNVVK